jgi:hypothetical protein
MLAASLAISDPFMQFLVPATVAWIVVPLVLVVTAIIGSSPTKNQSTIRCLAFFILISYALARLFEAWFHGNLVLYLLAIAWPTYFLALTLADRVSVRKRIRRKRSHSAAQNTLAAFLLIVAYISINAITLYVLRIDNRL